MPSNVKKRQDDTPDEDCRLIITWLWRLPASGCVVNWSTNPEAIALATNYCSETPALVCLGQRLVAERFSLRHRDNIQLVVPGKSQ